jgi:hypothetical protein
MKKGDRPLALQTLQQAFDEARRIDDNPRERAVVLIGETIQLFDVDQDRAWTLMAEAIKSANGAEDFTGEVTTLTVRVSSKRGLNAVALSGEFDLASALRQLTKNDLDRSIDLARSFKYDAPRSAALLAVASAVLEK